MEVLMETFLALVGFVGLIAIVILLLLDKTTPQVTFILVSSFVGFGLVLLENFGLPIGATLGVKDGVFSIKALAGFIKGGVSSVLETTALFIFSILFFTILSATGFFDKIINALIKKSGNNVYAVMFLTVLVAVIAHLDGSGASSFLIAIPALLPVYERLGIRKTTLRLILAASMGIMNLLPWGGPTLRVASITQADVNTLWFSLMPMQILGLLLALCLALYMGYVEKKLGAGSLVDLHGESAFAHIQDQTNHLKRESKFYINLVLLLGVISLLFFSKLPIYFSFMLGSSLALVVNYKDLSIQNEVVKDAAIASMMMATTLLAAGILIGIFDKTGIMKLMASLILNFIPDSLGVYLPIFIGLLAVPMALIFCTDSYFYGILPIVASVGSAFGIDALSLGIVMIVCRNCAAFISPVVPAALLGCGLSGVSIKEHIKTSFFWLWGISIICLFAGIFLGIIKF